MNTRYLDGVTFKKMMLAGAQRVILAQGELNKLNVFPVPDGDTGSNMAALFSSVIHDLQNSEEMHVGRLTFNIAESALNGSRGNSGAILAQFFQGMAQKAAHSEKIGLEKFAEMMSNASQVSREAIGNPVEGTIITVMHDWSMWVSQNWDQMEDFNELFRRSLQVALESLIRTPEQLEVLSINQVVDAGAQGFVNFLEGVAYFLETGDISQEVLPVFQGPAGGSSEAKEFDVSADLNLDPHAMHSGDLTNQYCTECIIHGEGLDLKKIRASLSGWGDSFVMVGGGQRVKIHIHTNSPARVFREANVFGELLETKADDMWAQYRAKINARLQKHIALVTDSACNLPQEFFVKYNIIVLPLQVIIDGQAYLDRVNLSSSEFIKKLEASNAEVSTSQPSPADIRHAFTKALSQSPAVIGIFLSSKLSGTFHNIEQLMKKIHEEEELYLFDSRTVSGALGLIVLDAAKLIQTGQPANLINKAIAEDIANTTAFVSLPTVKYAVKGGRLSKSAGLFAGIFNILPTLKIDPTGVPHKTGFTFGKASNRRKMLKQACQYAANFNRCELMVCHAAAEEEAQSVKETLQKKFPHQDIHIVELSPLIAAHGGPGTLAVAVLWKKI